MQLSSLIHLTNDNRGGTVCIDRNECNFHGGCCMHRTVSTSGWRVIEKSKQEADNHEALLGTSGFPTVISFSSLAGIDSEENMVTNWLNVFLICGRYA